MINVARYQKALIGTIALLGITGIALYAWFYYATYQYCDAPYIDKTPVTECDKLASSPFDQDRVSPPVWHHQLSRYEAIKACKFALAQYPDSPRLQFAAYFLYDKYGKASVISSLAKKCYRAAIAQRGYFLFPIEKISSIRGHIQYFRASRMLLKAETLDSGDAFYFYAMSVKKHDSDLGFGYGAYLDHLREGARLGNIFASYYLAYEYFKPKIDQDAREVQKYANMVFMTADAGYGFAAKRALHLLERYPYLDVPDDRKSKWRDVAINWRD